MVGTITGVSVTTTTTTTNTTTTTTVLDYEPKPELSGLVLSY